MQMDQAVGLFAKAVTLHIVIASSDRHCDACRRPEYHPGASARQRTPASCSRGGISDDRRDRKPDGKMHDRWMKWGNETSVPEETQLKARGCRRTSTLTIHTRPRKHSQNSKTAREE